VLLLITCGSALASSPRLESEWRLRAGLPADPGASERQALHGAQNLFDLGEGGLPQVYQTDLGGLRTRIRAGDHLAYVPAVLMLAAEGRIREAELYMILEGRDCPATRMDLAKGLSWFGRYSLGEYASRMLDPPADVESHSYAYRIAALVELDWMRTGPDGLFHPEALAGRGDLDLVWSAFLDEQGDPWPRDWISIGSLDGFLSRRRRREER